jgi:amino acid adenylation domain-containing protein
MTAPALERPAAADPADPQSGVFPLTDTQAGLLVAHRALPNRALYNVLAELDLDPVHSHERLRRALADLLSIQPALRTALHELPSPHARLVEPPSTDLLPLSLTEARTASAAASERDRLLSELGAHEFDLADAPLLRMAHLTCTETGTSTLIVCVHHTVFDGFSFAAVAADLDELLAPDAPVNVAVLRERRERGLRREVEAELAAAGTTEAERNARELSARLETTPEALLDPRPGRPAATAFRSVRRRLPLGAAGSDAADDACRNLGVSPFVLFSSVLAAVVARHTGAGRVVLGTPVVARRTAASFRLAGPFLNTLPLIVGIDWSETFDRFAAETVREQADAARRNAGVPWTRIVRHGRPDRTTSRNAYFSCMIAMQDSTSYQPGAAVRGVIEHGNGTAKVDLWLGATPTARGWLLELEYDSELIREPVADGIERSLLEALRRVSENPRRRLRELFSDPPPEQSAVTDGVVPVAHPSTLRDWLEEALTTFADRPAVEDRGRAPTYAELSARAEQVASALRGHGARPGDAVGLSTTTLTDTVTAMIAILRVGCAYVPLDSALPAERVDFMVGAADCRVIVSDAGIERTWIAEHHGEPSAADAVYIMFTSGSTGRPKGVLMGGGPLLNLTAWQIAALGLGPDSRFLQYAPLGFDVSFQEIVPTLLAGGTVVGREPADRRDLPAVAALVERRALTHVYLPVAALRAFVQAAADAGLAFDHLREVCVSGEQLTIDATVRAFFAERPHLRLVNLYGPTETHAVTTHAMSAGGPWPAHAPIGLPLANVTAHVIDATGHQAPYGVPGELYLGGACPAHGYINESEQTAERFTADPYGPPGGIRYRTGDRALRAEDGTLIFLGRDDDQVKIRGYRVELGEVETAAAALPGVAHAVAAVRGTADDRHLLLFVVPRGGAPADPAAMRAQLGGKLPSYMVPRAVLPVGEIPKTANGKVDRTALLGRADQLLADQRRTRVDSGPLRDDPLVGELEGLWRELLGIERIGADESLTDLGAHSLSVLTALARIEAEHGARVPMLEFFRAPTLSALADQIRRTLGEAK